ncbi:substrate-binding domain-containing protein [Pseudomonas syringae pv. actinidiae]|uniref:Periplasmic component n=6 Tax=Pseudomonas syringae TaxID=317 RepID=A0A2G9L3V0_PSESF|nr:substrate-binding domain-containing protein [Pseudomonas syringae]EPN60238.1 phosphate-binding protein [Pseudomonas syringae pv. actinidiae ICMP 19079]EPN81239.1 phosphate-binding protein [Pseudomonas syringae pv. actinidiae ICMP 19101]AKT29521.1 phosphate-binding protein [Pseudomonas syringae pv. actinidiae ICMP 18884]AOE55999.1 phosphate-binding protein [Pseudomonas syringae pv. actinidiae ICMP 18708]APP96965.1 phosphate-binding protein [Pseudomonas syringae pv. actinidiae]
MSFSTSASALLCSGLALLISAPSVMAEALVAPANASYLTRDGAIAIIGNDGMQDLIEKLNTQFTTRHQGFRFAVTARGSSVGIPALTADATAIAPMSREIWLGDMNGFKQVKGYEPFDIRIGYSGFGPRAPHKTPPALYVNAKNPLPGLSLTQVAQILTAGQPQGDINTWGQLGVTDERWKPRRIHVYGLRDDGGFATNLRIDKLGGLPFSAKYEALPTREDVIAAVANDVYGIGLTGWVNAAKTSTDVRVLALSEKSGGPLKTPDYNDVAAGAYPLSAYLHLYVDRVPGQKLTPFIKEYLRLALSDEGQQLVRNQRESEEGYVPLSAADLQREREKLEAL